MTCESARNLVESYLDNELDAPLSAEMAEHIATCPACAEAHGQNLTLRAHIRGEAPYYRAPAHLRDRIRIDLRQADRGPARRWQWIAIAASVLLAASLVWNAAMLMSRQPSAGLLAQNVISSHVRSLMGTHLLDVPSSDQHTVKPWFNGKLDFSPDVKDLAAQGFPLAGGRLEYIDGHAVAALVYQRRRHVINLFTWPAASADGEGEFSRNGYHVIHWTGAGMNYWAVSDLGPEELRQFASLYRAR